MRLGSQIFHSNHILVAEEHNHLENVAIVEEKLDGIDADGIRNQEDLPRLIQID